MKIATNVDRFLFEPSNRSLYLALFRVYIAIHIVKYNAFVWPQAKTLYSNDSFVSHYPGGTYLGFPAVDLARENLGLFFGIYSALAALMAFGVGRRWVVLGVALGNVVTQSLNNSLLDGGDNLLKFSLFYLVLANSFEHLSLSRKPGKQGLSLLLDRFSTRLAVMLLVSHICLVYTISGLSKAHADVWYNGTAIYYIFANDRFMGTSLNPYIGGSALLGTIGCYSTIVWESAFAFGVFVPRLRYIWLLVGVSMHAGIYTFMMIHDFQMLFVAHYGFFFRDAELLRAWRWLSGLFTERWSAPPAP